MDKRSEVPQASTNHNEIHPGNAKRLQEQINAFAMTMNHAIRANITEELQKRAFADATVLPPLSPAEMFDFLMDTDAEFLNWCFPFSPYVLKRETLGAIHTHILNNYRQSLVQTSEPDAEQ